MKFINGFPQCNADDMADSPVLAGMMALVDHPKQVNMRDYYIIDPSLTLHGYDFSNKRPVRYPFGASELEKNPRCFSRDQTILLVAGEAAQYGVSNFKPCWWAPNNMDEVTGKWKMPDWFSPSQRNHLKLCNGQKGSWLGYLWLWLDILWNGKFTPLREQNQLQAMCIVAGPEWVRRYCKANPKWREATMLYWCDAWPGNYNRGEPELAQMIIDKVKGYL